MGYEYYITLEKNDYPNAVKALSNAFQVFNEAYSIKCHANGFSLCTDDLKWSEALQISIEKADKYISNISEGESYLYCLSNLSGDEARRMKEIIRTTLDNMDCSYLFDDL